MSGARRHPVTGVLVVVLAWSLIYVSRWRPPRVYVGTALQGLTRCESQLVEEWGVQSEYEERKVGERNVEEYRKRAELECQEGLDKRIASIQNTIVSLNKEVRQVEQRIDMTGNPSKAGEPPARSRSAQPAH